MYFVDSIELLMVHCSSGNSLRISGLDKLKKLKDCQPKITLMVYGVSLFLFSNIMELDPNIATDFLL
jgi:hypothetical protein